MGLVKGKCTECGATLELNGESKAECICKYCGSKFFVQDAINNYNVNVEKLNINNSNVNITNSRSKNECPKCGSHNLTIGKATYAGWGVREWSCVDCGHMWMHTEDRQALDSMLNTIKDKTKQDISTNVENDSNQQVHKRCPKCDELCAEKYTDNEENEIYYCKNCDYAWIDTKWVWFGIGYFTFLCLGFLIFAIIFTINLF